MLIQFTWKRLNLNGGNKRAFKELKICKAVKGKHERSMFLPVVWIKLHKQVELIYTGYLPRWSCFRKLILILFSENYFSGGFIICACGSNLILLDYIYISIYLYIYLSIYLSIYLYRGGYSF